MALSMVLLPFALGGKRNREGERTVGEEEELYDMEDIQDEETELRQARIKRRMEQTRSADGDGVDPEQGRVEAGGSDEKEKEGHTHEEYKEKDTTAYSDEKSSSSPSSSKEPLPRTITIADHPTKYSKTLPYASAFPSRRKILRSSTIDTFSTFTSSLRTDWEHRHDRQRKGFWRRVLEFAIGGKDAVAAPRMGDENYVAPKFRWTPILSGLIIPFSILLEIPGLTEHWYVRDIKATGSDDYVQEYQENPKILDIGLGISIACGLLANAALISRFLERRVYTSTVVAICALTVHDIINIIAVTIFGVVHRFDDGFTYAEAFWLTVCSSVASLITNVTLIFDMVKTKDFKHSGSGLTPKQRSLVIAVMVLLAYIALGALVYNLMIPEFNFQTALYFTIVSIETIGFGDFAPSNTKSRIFFFFYETLGVLNLAVAVGTARDTLLESWEAAYKRRRQELQLKHKERKKQRVAERAKHRAIETRLLAIGAPVYTGANLGGGGRGGTAGGMDRHLNTGALTEEQLLEAEEEAAKEIEEAAAAAGPDWSKLSAAERKQKALDDIKNLNDEMSAQSIASESGYREFTEKIAREERYEGYVKFGFAFALFLTFWILGATIFSKTEDWTWFEAFYFCFVSFTTVGFGDFYPKTPAGRAFFVVWAIFGVATMTLLLAVIAEAYETTYKNSVHKKGLKQALEAMRRNNTVALTRQRTDTLLTVKRSQTMTLDPGSLGVTGLFGLTMGGENPEVKVVTEEEKMNPDWDNVKAGEIAVENLPYLVLQAVKSFNDHVQYFVHHHSADPPANLRSLLEAMTEEQAMSAQEKEEVMGDADARRVLFMMSYERTMQALVQIAERAILADQTDSSGAGGGVNPAGEAPLPRMEDPVEDEMEEIMPAPSRNWDPESNEDIPGWQT